MSSELRALDAQIDDRLKRLERQSDFGRAKDIPANIGAGLLWETCQDIRLFLKYRDEAQAKTSAPMELTNKDWFLLFRALDDAFIPEVLLGSIEEIHAYVANAARKWLAERSGG